MFRQLIAVIVLSTVAPGPAQAQAPVPRIAFVAVQSDVRLEVLDWGGRGPALVFLAGFGNTGHVFDGFAPQFTNRYHVIAITRRGFGASSRPRTGYDTRTLVQDLTTVLDSLKIRRAVWVGHSFAGTELSFLGAVHQERVASLIYLDASYDFAQLYADPMWQRAFPVPRPALPTTASIDEWRRWFTLVTGPSLPDDEIHVLTSSTDDDSLGPILQRGALPSQFRRIKAPVLAMWAMPRSVKDQYPYWGSLDSLGRARLQASFEDQQAVRGSHLELFRAELGGARIVSIAGARHFIFLTHARQVAAQMRAFLALRPSLPN